MSRPAAAPAPQPHCLGEPAPTQAARARVPPAPPRAPPHPHVHPLHPVCTPCTPRARQPAAPRGATGGRDPPGLPGRPCTHTGRPGFVPAEPSTRPGAEGGSLGRAGRGLRSKGRSEEGAGRGRQGAGAARTPQPEDPHSVRALLLTPPIPSRPPPAAPGPGRDPNPSGGARAVGATSRAQTPLPEPLAGGRCRGRLCPAAALRCPPPDKGQVPSLF